MNNNHKKFDFVNPFYMAEIDVFFPDTGVENLVLWKGFYFRHTMKVSPARLPLLSAVWPVLALNSDRNGCVHSLAPKTTSW